MKNMNPKVKKWLAVAGGLALCAVLVVLIGQRFQTPEPVDDPLPSQSSEVSDVMVDPSEPDSTEKEKDVTVTPPDTTQPVSTDNGAVSSGTEQTIQDDVSRSEYTEEQIKDPTVVTTPFDFTNKAPSAGIYHFGKVSKLQYNNGTSLTPMKGSYTAVKPAQTMPRIISTNGSNNIDAIKKYFCSEYVVKRIAEITGMNYDVLIGGKYKILLEPLAYCGDVLLQKTYVTDPISKKVKRNNGELPKVLIKNNHAPIVSRELYDRVQQERARRGSKRKVSKASVTEQSRYSSLHALSELLICGECATPYRRAVWTKRSGEKQAVWRCISRLDYGTKYCKDSVTLDEDSLHAAIMQAINDTRGSRRAMTPFVAAHVSRTLRENAKGGMDAEQMESRIAQLKAQTMELVAQSISSNTVGENEGRLRAMSDEVKALCDMLTEYRQSCNAHGGIENRMAEITEALANEPEQSESYDDTLVRQLIDTIRVVGENKLEIIFRSGLTHEQDISPKVKKLVRVS